jgi:hypothetical protein
VHNGATQGLRRFLRSFVSIDVLTLVARQPGFHRHPKTPVLSGAQAASSLFLGWRTSRNTMLV